MGVFVTGRQVALEIPMPGWWLPGASVDLDFDSGRYYDSSTANPRAATDFLSCTRASTGYAKDSSGNWISFGSNILRITDLGILVEDARTNLFLNSQAPVTQIITVANGTAYTVSVYGTASVVLSGAGTGTATQGTDVTFTASTTSLTCTVSGAGGAFQNVNVEAGSFSSSPIVTTSTSATRAQDVVLCIGNANTIFNAQPMSAIIDFKDISGGSGLGFRVFWPGSGSSYAINNADTDFDHAIVWNPLAKAVAGSGTVYTGAKLGIAQDASNGSAVLTGGTVITGSAPGIMPNVVLLTQSGASSVTNFGYVRRLTLWNSKLADATLQALTAP